MGCSRTISFSGDRISKIKSAIQELKKKEFKEKIIPKLKEDKKLFVLYDEIKLKEIELKKLEDSFDKYKEKLQISMDSKKDVYPRHDVCFIPKEDLELISKCINLRDFGKQKEAKDLMESLIIKYNLFNYNRELEQ